MDWSVLTYADGWAAIARGTPVGARAGANFGIAAIRASPNILVDFLGLSARSRPDLEVVKPCSNLTGVTRICSGDSEVSPVDSPPIAAMLGDIPLPYRYLSSAVSD